MKTQFQALPLVGISALLSFSAQGATSITYNFESQSDGDLFAGDVAGWTQDQPNLVAFGTTFPLGYIASSNFSGVPTNAGHLGTQRANTPDNASTTLTGVLGLSGIVGPTDIPQVSLNLAIIDNPGDAFAGRDAFSVVVKSGAGTVMAEIDFTPTSGVEQFWDISAGISGSSSATALKAQAGQGYLFNINFGASETSFSLAGSGGVIPNTVFLTSAALAVTDFGTIEIIHNPLAPVGTSANTLTFDNVQASIPEPSGVALLLLGSLGLLGRRRS